MNKQMKKNEKGFTLIELIIVIAVMGIIAAVLVPSFTQMTAKTKVSTDIRSIQMMQSQLDLYRAEHENKYPQQDGKPGTDESRKVGGSADHVIEGLVAAGYLEAKDSTATDNVSKMIGLQSGATIVWDETIGNLAIGATNPQNKGIDKIIKGLATGTDKDHVFDITISQ